MNAQQKRVCAKKTCFFLGGAIAVWAAIVGLILSWGMIVQVGAVVLGAVGSGLNTVLFLLTGGGFWHTFAVLVSMLAVGMYLCCTGGYVLSYPVSFYKEGAAPEVQAYSKTYKWGAVLLMLSLLGGVASWLFHLNAVAPVIEATCYLGGTLIADWHCERAYSLVSSSAAGVHLVSTVVAISATLFEPSPKTRAQAVSSC